MPQGQSAPDHEIDYEQSKKHAFAQAACVEREPRQQKYPNQVGCGRPPVVRPVVLIVSNVAERDPCEVGTSEKASDAPQWRPAHEVARTVRKLGVGLDIPGFYLPVHVGGRLSRKAMIPSRASAVETSSSR